MSASKMRKAVVDDDFAASEKEHQRNLMMVIQLHYLMQFVPEWELRKRKKLKRCGDCT